jgi:hypothetical protein
MGCFGVDRGGAGADARGDEEKRGDDMNEGGEV